MTRAGLAAVALWVTAAMASCQPAGTTTNTAGATPPPAPSATPSPPAAAPAAAVLTASDVGLPLLSARDGISLGEAVRDQADQALALRTYQGWGWADASRRTWGSGARSADEILLLTLRPQGAERAFASWSQDTETAPLAGAACGASLRRLDQCRIGSAGDGALIVGRAGADVFRQHTRNLDAALLAARQAARLRSAR